MHGVNKHEMWPSEIPPKGPQASPQPRVREPRRRGGQMPQRGRDQPQPGPIPLVASRRDQMCRKGHGMWNSRTWFEVLALEHRTW